LRGSSGQKSPRVAFVDSKAASRKALMRLMRSAELDAETFDSGHAFLKFIETRRRTASFSICTCRK
jgi:FixJ family two-component response regulator